MPLTVAYQMLQDNLTRWPGKVAYHCDGRALTFAALDECARRFASLLADRGIKPGDRVVITLPDSFSHIVALLGTMLIGGCPVLVNPLLQPDDIDGILDDCGAVALVASPGTPVMAATSLRHRIVVDDATLASLVGGHASTEAAWAADPDDMTFLHYTSGTTGAPKGVPHRHQDLTYAADHYAQQILGITCDDVVFSTSKLFFAYGLGNSFAFPLHVGATAILLPAKPAIENIVAILDRHRPTVFFSVPAIYDMLLRGLDDGRALASVRLCVSAGEALPATTFEAWQRLTGLAILDGIGSTEAFHIFISNRPGEARPGSSGRIVPPYEARLIGEYGEQVPSGQPGNLQIRGGSLARAYWQRPDQTAVTMLPDGWVRTGDVYVEEDGFYRHLGRSDDMFKVDAQWISPVLVETVLLQHQGVAECAVVPAALLGVTRASAHVVLRKGWEPSVETMTDVRRFARDRLPPHAVPARVVFSSALPRTATGKTQRFRLRET